MRALLIILIVAFGLGVAVWFAISDSDINADVASESESTYSNIHPGDYVGAQACSKCHTEHFDDWSTHAHSKMNLNPSDETVKGEFSGEKIAYGNGHVIFEKQNNEFFMSLFEKESLSRRYRVTRTVGSRLTQMYIGLQTEGPEPEDHHAYHSEGKLPFGYWMKRKMWTPVTYFDSAYEEEPENASEQSALLAHPQQDAKWELNCLYCHNTYAYQHRLYFASAIGFPREDFVVPGGSRTLEEYGALKSNKLVALGISCESCHYGGREHVENGLPTRYYPSSPDLSLDQMPLDDHKNHASVINSICMQCHCAKVTLYPNGAGTWNSREATDLKTGACMEQVKCTDCHNPHRPGLEGGLFSDDRIVAKCMECHQEYQDDTVRLLHTQHSDSSASCMDCHMPRIVQGLDRVIRTHHISSPTDVGMLKPGAPNSCNVCHLGRPITWTVDKLNKGWGTSIQTDSGWSHEYGEDLQTPVGEAWLKHTLPIMRLIVSDAYARHPNGRNAVPELLAMLKDSYAVNRMFGLFAIERILGETLDEYNPMDSAEARNLLVEKLRKRIGGVDLSIPSAASHQSTTPTKEDLSEN